MVADYFLKPGIRSISLLHSQERVTNRSESLSVVAVCTCSEENACCSHVRRTLRFPSRRPSRPGVRGLGVQHPLRPECCSVAAEDLLYLGRCCPRRVAEADTTAEAGVQGRGKTYCYLLFSPSHSSTRTQCDAVEKRVMLLSTHPGHAHEKISCIGSVRSSACNPWSSRSWPRSLIRSHFLTLSMISILVFSIARGRSMLSSQLTYHPVMHPIPFDRPYSIRDMVPLRCSTAWILSLPKIRCVST